MASPAKKRSGMERRLTEQRNAASKNVDRMTAMEIVRVMNREDAKGQIAGGRGGDFVGSGGGGGGAGEDGDRGGGGAGSGDGVEAVEGGDGTEDGAEHAFYRGDGAAWTCV